MTNEKDVFDALKHRVVVDRYGNCRYYNGAGELHRVGDPAVTYPDGTKLWYQNNLLHREDGPAVILAGTCSHCWFLHGVEYSTERAYIDAARKLHNHG